MTRYLKIRKRGCWIVLRDGDTYTVHISLVITREFGIIHRKPLSLIFFTFLSFHFHRLLECGKETLSSFLHRIVRVFKLWIIENFVD